MDFCNQGNAFDEPLQLFFRSPQIARDFVEAPAVARRSLPIDGLRQMELSLLVFLTTPKISAF